MAAKDVQFRSQYHEHAYYWMSSWQCTFTGVLAVTSAEKDEITAWNVQIKENIEKFRKEFQELNMEHDAMKTSFADALKGNVAVKEAAKVSVLILSFMSVERWLCITWPLGAPKLSSGRAKLALGFIWAIGFIIATAPVIYYSTNSSNKQGGGFYGTNGLCFPLHLDDPWVPGWLYSAIIFVGLNQLGVVMILISYTWMFCSIRHTRANTPLALGDREFAIRFFFIVFTDCVCWIPIIVLRVMALSEFIIPRKSFLGYTSKRLL
ncbi:7 transmembrane receptor (rhodopsin) [Halocaridina rubra]|uniref:7 transmembrane receptor (Rhodopsin) n=1 Tax=Halocaridina rubra TaxID=373956 RepID=A0AAN8WYY3_HALRR